MTDHATATSATGPVPAPWPASTAHPPDPPSPEASPPLGQTAEQVRDRLVRGAQSAVLLVGVAVQLTSCLPQLIANRDRFGPWWTELVAFVMLAGVAVTAAAGLLRPRPMPRPLAFALCGVCVAASALASIPIPPDLLLVADDWSFGIAGWYILALLLRMRMRTIAAFFACHALVTLIEVLLKGVPERYITVQMGMVAVSVFGLELAVALLAVVLHHTASDAGEAAEREERTRTAEEVAEATHRDHQARYARLLDTTVPLLTGLAYGALDPGDETVRRRAAIETARMRQLFAETDEVSDPLLHELRAGIDVAERQGVSVQLAVRGEIRPVPQPVRQELVAAAAAVLASARTTARATVMRTQAAVRVSVVADAPAEIGAAIDAEQRTRTETTTTTKNGKLWVEAVWRTKSP
ncbi:hypothetical protein FB384_004972 [Prauserella sediminis]|uniref:Signal transduction histidine kinase n=1 Tax=Prauserella sediminis TaxID=577680 RepID=A0A839XQB4_9PSEU|nr:hypothetical protein [Prauserella sediminis]MBB3666012.1 hypothetical protein [Prauserella sediminis]